MNVVAVVIIIIIIEPIFAQVATLTFFIMPVLRLLNVVYLLSLLWMNSILIRTRPLVFLPFAGSSFLMKLGPFGATEDEEAAPIRPMPAPPFCCISALEPFWCWCWCWW